MTLQTASTVHECPSEFALQFLSQNPRLIKLCAQKSTGVPVNAMKGYEEGELLLPLFLISAPTEKGPPYRRKRAQYNMYTGNSVTQHIAERKTRLPNGGREGQWLCPNARTRGKSR
jgi:hypothetical protein